MSKKAGAKRSPVGAKRSRTQRSETAKRDDTFEARLREAISMVDVANALTAPLISSIEDLLRIAARSVNTDAASVLVRDGTRGGLKFMVAIGKVADKLLKVRLPPGKGIAGFVFSSGQPVVVADVAQDQSFYAEVDRATGHSTQIILATPLRADGEMVGVLEFVNRFGEPPFEPFSPDEMDRAAHFADAIATLVVAHETAGLIETLFARAMAASAKPARQGRAQDSSSDLRRWLKRLRAAPEHRDLLLLAVSLREIASRGDAERELCRDVLEALSRFTQKRAASGGTYFGF
jgi:signal transduction protein with GAF and PtsI domain